MIPIHFEVKPVPANWWQCRLCRRPATVELKAGSLEFFLCAEHLQTYEELEKSRSLVAEGEGALFLQTAKILEEVLALFVYARGVDAQAYRILEKADSVLKLAHQRGMPITEAHARRWEKEKG